MTTPTRLTGRTAAIIGGVAAVVIAAVVILFVTTRGDDSTTTGSAAAPSTTGLDLTTPYAVGDAFVDDYAAGNTPAAALLASGNALQSLQQNGWDTKAAGWLATATRVQGCQLPQAGDYGLVYDTNADVNGHRGVELVVSGSGTVWKVTKVMAGAEESSCSIYASSSG
jgi:hypothetical protein